MIRVSSLLRLWPNTKGGTCVIHERPIPPICIRFQLTSPHGFGADLKARYKAAHALTGLAPDAVLVYGTFIEKKTNELAFLNRWHEVRGIGAEYVEVMVDGVWIWVKPYRISGCEVQIKL